ncbi:DegT/DnrJ/EryC1/StrS family aminotransferase [Streptomyces sp. KL116D]|uniref:DegT/DnrJ/EryC1/StrS family aminotransferase n=1 Tax=Streptomyces sp. KL116D TaxID=3045152 RepID=UPI003558BEF7
MPTIGDRARFLARLEWALDSDWLTNGGPLTTELEGRIADLAGVRYCVAVQPRPRRSNWCCGPRGDGQVIMPSLTFAATPHAAAWVGLEPVFCDVDPGHRLPRPRARRGARHARHRRRPRARPPVPDGPVIELEKLAAEHGVKLFFGAARTPFGYTAGDRPVLAASADAWRQCSWPARHQDRSHGAFEGGAGDRRRRRELAERLVALRNFGIGPGPGQ